MSRVERALRRIAADLEAANQHWCLIGGLAVSVRAEPRTTRDVDLMVSVAGDAEAEEVVFSLQSAGYRMATVLQHTSTGRLATVRLFPPGEGERGALVDLLFASSGIEPEIVAAAENLRILPKLTVPVARTGISWLSRCWPKMIGAARRTSSTFALSSRNRRRETSSWRGNPFGSSSGVEPTEARI